LSDQSDSREWRFYGRRAGRKLNAARQDAVDTLLPKLQIPEEAIIRNGALPPTSLFSDRKDKIVLEIGFGNGEHLAEMARREPKTGFIGAEPFINGVSAFLTEPGMAEAQNVRLHPDDALALVYSLADKSVDSLYILNPDPWHKKRHFKRRIINPENLGEFSRILKPGGDLIFSTDVPDLAEWMVMHAVNHPAFEWQAKCRKDWLEPPEDWIPTRYETKGAKGAARMHYFFFKKRA
jgi:tRNA (guanine-N7-)-methyltransferase